MDDKTRQNLLIALTAVGAVGSVGLLVVVLFPYATGAPPTFWQNVGQSFLVLAGGMVVLVSSAAGYRLFENRQLRQRATAAEMAEVSIPRVREDLGAELINIAQQVQMRWSPSSPQSDSLQMVINGTISSFNNLSNSGQFKDRHEFLMQAYGVSHGWNAMEFAERSPYAAIEKLVKLGPTMPEQSFGELLFHVYNLTRAGVGVANAFAQCIASIGTEVTPKHVVIQWNKLAAGSDRLSDRLKTVGEKWNKPTPGGTNWYIPPVREI